MKFILAQETITDKEVIIFLKEISADSEVLKSRMVNSNNPRTKEMLEDVNDMYTSCETISDKLEKGFSLTQEEKAKLKRLLLVNKKQIEREPDENTTTGIDKYISQLE